VFGEVLKHLGPRCLDQAAALCYLSLLDSREAKAFRESYDSRTRILMVALDEHDPSIDIIGQWAGGNLDR
jgi:hypothetical protein